MTYNCKYGYYYYDDPNHKHAVTRIEKNGQTIDTYQYDANGNMTGGAGRTLTYDYDNRPTSILYNNKATVNVYDAFGNRARKMVPSQTQDITTYIGQLYECNSNTGDCTKYIFAGEQRIANIKGAETYYYHTDHLQSSNIVTDKNGTKVEDIYYYPYGEIRTDTGTLSVRHKFTGHEYDAETGLIYMGARYYDPKLARFISADTIVPMPFYPQTLNRYSYAINNPIVLRELDGHCFWSTVVSWIGSGYNTAKNIVIAFVGGAIATAAALVTGLATGFNGAKMTNVANAVINKANSIATVLGGAIGGGGGFLTGTGYSWSAGNGGGGTGKLYAEAGAYDVKPTTSEDEINLLGRLTYAEASGEYKTPNAMEGVAWSVRNRVDSNKKYFGGDTYAGVIYNSGEFDSIGGTRWNEVGNPSGLKGTAATAYNRALTVATGVYRGTISDPTNGAVYFHSGSASTWFQSATKTGKIQQTTIIGKFTFYK